MIVRHVIEEGRHAARLEDAVPLRRPEIGAQEEFLRRPVQHDHLAGIAIAEAVAREPLLELGDGEISEEVTIIGQPLQQRPGGGEAVFVGRIEPALVERVNEVAEPHANCAPASEIQISSVDTPPAISAAPR